MNLIEKIANIMTQVEYLKKDDKVEFGKTTYKAMSEEKVTMIMHKKLADNKIIVYPVKMDHRRDGIITHVDVIYRMVNAEDPNDFIEIASCGDGADTQDKGSGKAMTYAYKYMWLRTFAIPTGEDPDKISSAEIDDKVAKEKAQKADEAKKTEPAKNTELIAEVQRLISRALELKVITPEAVQSLPQQSGVQTLAEIPCTRLQKLKEQLQQRISENDGDQS
jgi:hypothetical protein